MTDLNYYLISVPYNDNGTQRAQAQYDLFRNSVELPREARFSQFEIPPLKVGTLDTLMDASDDLVRVDPQLETATGKILQFLEDVSGTSREELAKVRADLTCEQYIANFKWDDKRYDLRDPTKAIIDRISSEAQSYEDKVRLKLLDYTETKKKLSQAQRKEHGNLTVKPVGEEIRNFNRHTYGDENPLDTEYLTTLYVVVPASGVDEWMRSYWSLGEIEFVVPGSSAIIVKDKDFALVNVVLFKKFLEDYKKECRKRKWIVRETAATDSMTTLETEGLQNSTDDLRTQLVRLLSTSFSEVFQAYVHVKALRVFVESVLKYGLPPRFVTVSFRLTEKQERTLRSKLRHAYSFLQTKFEEQSDGGALQNEYPYVSVKMLNLLRSK